MEFEGQYLTYEEYMAIGGTLDLMPFNLLEFEARRKIDIRTSNRLKNVDSIPEEVKFCVYTLINSIKTYANTINTTGTSNITSENIDGYSVSYLTPDRIKDVVKSKSAELDDIIRTYLLGVIYNEEHLMYVGVE